MLIKSYQATKERNSMKTPKGEELINRYKKNYGIPSEVNMTEEMVLFHWNLELQLTAELLNSTPANRWEVFDRCYSTLYSRVDWLNRHTPTGTTTPPDQLYFEWPVLIGQQPKKVYEIGSGNGELINFLAEQGHDCTATEITIERGHKNDSTGNRIAWHQTDGVHCDKFESPSSYDVVISNQVVEHLHPDDVVEHFKSIHAILKKSGKYILNTPHAFFGPSDLSRVFNCDESQCMHLKEYTFTEIRKIALRGGFRKVGFVVQVPRKIQKYFGVRSSITASSAYLMYLIFAEYCALILPRSTRKKFFQRLNYPFFSSSIFVVAEKTAPELDSLEQK